jgi:hypothetical protein
MNPNIRLKSVEIPLKMHNASDLILRILYTKYPRG